METTRGVVEWLEGHDQKSTQSQVLSKETKSDPLPCATSSTQNSLRLSPSTPRLKPWHPLTNLSGVRIQLSSRSAHRPFLPILLSLPPSLSVSSRRKHTSRGEGEEGRETKPCTACWWGQRAHGALQCWCRNIGLSYTASP